MSKGAISRRAFLATATATAAAACAGGPKRIRAVSGGNSPNNKINIAAIGVGGRGGVDLKNLEGENIVALCDVDEGHAANSFKRYPHARRYTDFRRLLDREANHIDAVLVATPDHTHAVAGLAAMDLVKHLYCEKPLAHSIHEVRLMMKMARRKKVVTQLGNQGHSTANIRRFCEWIWDGAIGEVREIHAFQYSKTRNSYTRVDDIPALKEKHPVPAGVDWDLWLGPAQWRRYHPLYMPGAWRAWMPFGTGSVGDWVCHVVDPSFWALALGAPDSIRADVENYDSVAHRDTYPPSTKITYQFPAKGGRGPVRLVWYDGAADAPRPEALESGRKPPATGAYIVGTKGTIMHGSHGADACCIIPETQMQAYKRPDPSIPRVKNHYDDWLSAIREGRQAGASFEYGGPLTEIALLGLITIKFPEETLQWDAARMRFTNCRKANQYLKPVFREGWGL